MLEIRVGTRFKKDYKRAIKRGCKETDFRAVVGLLADGRSLPRKYRDHALTNSRDYQNVRECHIQPDWLLIYRVDQGRLILELIRTGSHSDLFK